MQTKVEALIAGLAIQPALINKPGGPMQVFQFIVTPTDGKGKNMKPHQYTLTTEHLQLLVETAQAALQAVGQTSGTPPAPPEHLQ